MNELGNELQIISIKEHLHLNHKLKRKVGGAFSPGVTPPLNLYEE